MPSPPSDQSAATSVQEYCGCVAMTRGQDPPRDPGNQRELSSREAGGSSGLGLHHRGQNGRGGLQIVVVKVPRAPP